LSAHSIGYAFSVLNALFRWLVEQRYVLANPFSGLKVRGASRVAALDASRSFSEDEWALLGVVTNGLEWSHGWSLAAAQRLRFIRQPPTCMSTTRGGLGKWRLLSGSADRPQL
jgi:hypothetical protein